MRVCVLFSKPLLVNVVIFGAFEHNFYRLLIVTEFFLKELHANAIVHGSIRSKNIMIDADFIPKLTNFKSPHAEDDKRWWAPELFKEVIIFY